MIRPRENNGGVTPPMGVFTVDGTLTVRTWDGWLAEATGIPAERAEGRLLSDVVPSIAARRLLEAFESVLRTGEVRVLAPTFHHFLVPCPPRVPSAHFENMQQRATLGPLREGSAIVGVLAAIEDVTERVEAERALAASLRSADPAEREAATRRLAEASRLETPESLTPALGDSHWRVRRAAVEGLARHASAEMLRALIASLRREHRDLNVLNSALQLLAASDVDVTAPLVELMQDPDAALRLQAALALGEQHHPDAIAALIAALDDTDANVRFHAIEALGRLRAAEASDRLADIAAAGDFFLAFPAIDALARINDGRVAPRLVPLLASPDLRDPVADALGELGDAHVVEPLVTTLNRGEAVTPVVRAVASLYTRYEHHYGGGALIADRFVKALEAAGAQALLDALAGAAVEDLRAYVLVLGWLRGAAVERELTRLLATPEIRREAIEAVVRQGETIVDRLIAQLEGDEVDVRIAAVTALARIGSPKAVPALLRALESGDRPLVIAAAATLGSLTDPSAFEPLLRLAGDADPSIRQAAVGALNSLGHPDMGRRVAELLHSPDPLVRESAARIAGYFGYPEAAGALVACCADPDERVRRAALEQMGLVEAPGTLEALVSALERDTPRARASAALALASVDGPRAGALLLRAAGDDDPWVRYFAARGLAGRDALEPLARLAACDPAPQVRFAAIESLGRCEGPGPLDVLLPLAGGDDEELACAALRALARVASPRAFSALEDAARTGTPGRRRAAIDALGRAPCAQAIAVLEWAAAADADEDAVARAIAALGAWARRPDEGSAAAVRALVSLTADPARRDAAVAVLGRLPADRIPAVALGLQHGQAAVRRSIVDALGRLRHPDASALLRHGLDDPDPGVREAAVIALDRLGARGVSRLFAHLARHDASKAVRRAAAAALGHQADAS